MTVSFQPHAFDAAAFERDVGAGTAIVNALVAHTLEEPAFDWSLDGTDAGEFICERVDDEGAAIGSLVDVVLRALGDDDEISGLLASISRTRGRLVAEPPYIGFLLPEEIRRATTLLGGLVFTDVDGERDRRLLVAILERTVESGVGVYWVAL